MTKVKRIAIGISGWLALITIAHVSMNVNWAVVLNDHLPESARKLNVAYIPVT